MSLPSSVPVESRRDLDESSFTPILRSVLHCVPGVLAVVFVDSEGECIDYCSSLPPFDAKVIAAHMLVVTSEVRETTKRRAGEPWAIHVQGSERDIVVRRVTDEYLLVVVTLAMGIPSLLTETIELAVRKLRVESGEVTPRWEPAIDARVRVEVRVAKGWPYAPSAFWMGAERTKVGDVLGRWIEEDDGARVVCFMVRSESGQELTLVHHVEEDRWERR
ncbi:roadblock/LC7 domain-containing protein [Sandaracinus amylolyticus]|uniref:roadblock/LC7 domain-containing protein n=1 Tax=Sandaracinus amylolyticus TaxID=927083 RepID=UPI001F44C1D2|nr:roadblock/LC7 domain-containing protein [Sandaracinus amylolyticus]UJR79499.1 Hypothetical protein I5071_15350 [Sandaracinus amylolyticus]